MINFPSVTEQHEKLRHEVRTFAEKEIKPVADKLDHEARFSPELVRRMGSLGYFGITVPTSYGGQGLDNLSYIIVVEELARIDSSQAVTVASQNSLGIAPILNYGSVKQKNELLPRLTTGEHLWAFGLTEPEAGSDSRNTKTNAKLINGEWVINGSKIFITNSSSELSAGSTIQAVTKNNNGNPELTCIIVPRESKGYYCEPVENKMMWRAADTGRLEFKDCTVPEENLLGGLGQGSRIMLDTLDSGRLSIAAMGLGLAQGAYEMALRYARGRVQFGKAVFRFQGVSFKLADIAMKIEHARNTLYKACWLKDIGKAFAKEAAMAKLFCSELAREASHAAVQTFGGYGLMKNNPVERFYRDQRILEIGEGTSEILRLVISRHIARE
jgi:alkylation response protein AidB-like acyl-CoA dehydrogenase